jgi:pyridoxal phosphate enzyme (YggS family)
MLTLADLYELVHKRIAIAAKHAGREPESIRLIAVSKGRPLSDIYALHQLGHRDFGENRAEEGGDKISASQRDHKQITWHMIGHVQRRKAREIAADFDWVHSLDGGPLAERLSRAAGEAGKVMPVLLECNVSGEENKYGLAASKFDTDPAQWEALCTAIEPILAHPNLSVKGLMTMAPIVPLPEEARPVFTKLRALRDALAKKFPQASWHELSMGMTDDFEVAIEEGATMVRIGRAIFAPEL